MSMAETQLVLRHSLELSNPASASRDLDPVSAASITSLSMLRDGRFEDTVRSFWSPRGIEEEVLVLIMSHPSCFMRQSLGRAGV